MILPRLHLFFTAKRLVFGLCWLPLIGLLYAAVFNHLGANPAEALIRETGIWGLRFLCLTLAITPARKMFKINLLAPYRRSFGLWAYTYLALHVVCYCIFDRDLSFAEILQDLNERTFIVLGWLSFTLLSLLALTSPRRIIKRMGTKKWQGLHRSIYAISILALVHFFLIRQGKNNFEELVFYAVFIFLMLGWRVLHFLYLKNKSH